jgi:hypothetical protein
MGRGCRTLDEDDYEHAEVGAEDAEHSRPEGIPRLIDDNAATDSSGHFGREIILLCGRDGVRSKAGAEL